MKTAKESHIQQLNLKVEDYKNAYDSVIIANKMLKKEIERLTAESTKWESKFYDEAKKNDKLNLFDKIEFDIAMELYGKHNDRIASINDHLGEMYGYKDLQEAIDLEKEDELDLYKKALKEKCEVISKAIEYLEERIIVDLEQEQQIEEVVDILRGEDYES